MRSERRHELQRNDLLDKLSEYYQFIGPYTNVILAGVLIVVLFVAAWRWYAYLGTVNLAAGWTELDVALEDSEPMGALEDVAERYSGTVVGEWAALTAADLRLAQGLDQLFHDREIARNELEKAVQGYDAVIAGSEHSHIKEQAHFGLGRAYEGLLGAFRYETEKMSLEAGGLDTSEVQAKLDSSMGERRDSALANYQAVVDDWPDGAYAVLAKRFLQDLQRPSTKEFYDSFAAYDPRPPAMDFPGGGFLGGGALDPDTLLEGGFPPSLFSDFGDNASPTEESPAEGTPDETAPPEGTPADGAPDEKAPPEEMPLEGTPDETPPVGGTSAEGAPVEGAGQTTPAPDAP